MNKIVEMKLTRNKIVEMQFGSRLYGTDTENSDLDIKGVYIPTAREIVLGNYQRTISTTRPKHTYERNTKDDVDVEMFSLDRYLQLLAQGQTVALDMLFAPSSSRSEATHPLWHIIRYNKDKMLHKNINAFLGYAKQQAAKYGIKGSRMEALKQTVALLSEADPHSRLLDNAVAIARLRDDNSQVVSLEGSPLIDIVMIASPNNIMLPHLEVANRKVAYTAKVKHALEIYKRVLDEYGGRAHKAHLDGGKDYKALHHAVRVASEAKELLLTGNITFPRPDRELLLAIKLRQLPYEAIAELIEQGLVDIVEAQKKSTLREEADQEWMANFIYDVYSGEVRK